MGGNTRDGSTPFSRIKAFADEDTRGGPEKLRAAAGLFASMERGINRLSGVGGRLRAFVSSTMLDLANERAEVVQRLEELNIEPVRAEEIEPTGQRSWERLTSAIEECDIFILILGESYGWIPEKGPMAHKGKSVTELEFEHAYSIDLPILAFVKKLGQRESSATEDSRRRDTFRAEVEGWDEGLFRTQFELARDLAEHVGRAVAGLVADRFRAAAVADRRATMPPQPETRLRGAETPELPHDLIEATADGSAVLLLGAGASLEAGMPSAAMFIEAMAAEIRRLSPDYQPGLSGTTFNAVATDFESLRGEEALQKLARGIVEPGFAIPTEAHRIAGRLFRTVLTTNYDLLLERALAGTGREFTVIDGEASIPDLAAPHKLIKLHGSLDRPQGLILTESQLASLESDRPNLWRALVDLLRTSPLLSVGSSLRDPSLIRLLEVCRPTMRGWAVLGRATETEHRRLRRWNLEVIPGDADGVLKALEERIDSLPRSR